MCFENIFHEKYFKNFPSNNRCFSISLVEWYGVEYEIINLQYETKQSKLLSLTFMWPCDEKNGALNLVVIGSGNSLECRTGDLQLQEQRMTPFTEAS